ncbi:hypothetical protein HAX54_051199 [Datura stramonium]|uniref:Uncharacterized protein n=1 Tax=Datura stramonium TaxID=4076 RepID=A0ABS8WM53_DATST|nr:hypothetical protein [Datura stramonium]
MGLKPETRRALVYNKHGAWVDTKSLNISIGDSAASCKDRQTRKEISDIQDYLHAKDISLLKRKYRQILHTNKSVGGRGSFVLRFSHACLREGLEPFSLGPKDLIQQKSRIERS